MLVISIRKLLLPMDLKTCSHKELRSFLIIGCRCNSKVYMGNLELHTELCLIFVSFPLIFFSAFIFNLVCIFINVFDTQNDMIYMSKRTQNII